MQSNPPIITPPKRPLAQRILHRISEELADHPVNYSPPFRILFPRVSTKIRRSGDRGNECFEAVQTNDALTNRRIRAEHRVSRTMSRETFKWHALAAQRRLPPCPAAVSQDFEAENRAGP